MLTDREGRDALVKRLVKLAEEYDYAPEGTPLSPTEAIVDFLLGDDVWVLLTAQPAGKQEAVAVGYLHVGGDFAGEREEWEFEAIQKACDKINQDAGIKEQRLTVYVGTTPSERRLALEEAAKVCDAEASRYAGLSMVSLEDVARRSAAAIRALAAHPAESGKET